MVKKIECDKCKEPMDEDYSVYLFREKQFVCRECAFHIIDWR